MEKNREEPKEKNIIYGLSIPADVLAELRAVKAQTGMPINQQLIRAYQYVRAASR